MWTWFVSIIAALVSATPSPTPDMPPAASDAAIFFDFANPRDNSAWGTVDDPVMGGISRSTWQASEDGTALWTGAVSLDNNGGFCSATSATFFADLRAYAGVELVVRGAPKDYTFTLRDGRSWRILHSADFSTDGTWQTLRLPFSDFVPERFGVPVRADALDVGDIRMMGFIISDKQVGEFSLELATIGVYKND